METSANDIGTGGSARHRAGGKDISVDWAVGAQAAVINWAILDGPTDFDMIGGDNFPGIGHIDYSWFAADKEPTFTITTPTK